MNGPLAPLRNLQVVDPLVRLPLAVGLAHLLATVQLPAGRKVVASVTVAAIGALALPSFTSGLSAPGDFERIPGYWQSAASWLNRHAGNQAVLEVPGVRFGDYLWGRPRDDVLQPLFTGDWASGQFGSLGSPGLGRLLDAIDQRLAAGEGSAGLSALLARMGVKYVLVRNDLNRGDLHGAWPGRIHQALSESPGIVKVARFGALPVGHLYPDDAVTNLDTLYWPVEIYQVTAVQPAAELLPAAAAIRVYGGPEALLTLADEHMLGNRAVLLNSDAAGTLAGQTVVTDSLRRRMRSFGEIRAGYPAPVVRLPGGASERLYPGQGRTATVTARPRHGGCARRS
jgi:arabinofuranan 3-O-arabinosyltransferase